MKPSRIRNRIHPLSGLRRRQRGISLVELMIAVVIGMITVGALFAAYLAANQTSRHSRAVAQMSEDASAAFAIMRNHVAMTGYSKPTSAASGQFIKNYTGRELRGCDDAFVDTSSAIDTLSCATVPGTGAHNSFAVAYEADTANAPVSSTNVPLDCLGNQLTLSGGYYLNTARFYLDTPSGASARALYCRGNTATGGQALVENIEDLQVRYGLPTVARQSVTHYASASQMESNLALYGNVVSMRVCVVVASAQPVLDAITAYTPCFPSTYGQTVMPTDRRLYRAFTSTIVLQNRASLLSS